jgi:3-methyladenine DNA glycosylase AlkD
MDLDRAVSFVQATLTELAEPEKVAGMQAYMKTDMPFYGVQKPGRVQILRRLKSDFPLSNHDEYEGMATALWELPHREEKYLAQGVATAFPAFIVPDSMPLYRRFIVEGAWWDFVDEAATHMVRELVVHFPEEIWPVVETWVDDDDMWLRRAAILCQVGAKERTDAERLFRFCVARAHEKEFFIRKAIGWALREHSKTDPGAVAGFVTDHRDDLSGLSYREATKHLGGLVG